jgi:hypothetical protein
MMQSMKSTKPDKLNRKLLAIIALFGVAFIALDSALALAAYVALTWDAFNNNTTTETLSWKYFSGGSGTSSDPYLIKTPDNLRNLQKLNSLGLFNSQTSFQLGSYYNNTIEWSGDPLLPIGTDDQPFEGVFDGNGVTINGLVVNGYNTWDIGMFGYVSITGTVKNFFLDHPIIYVGSNSDGGHADTTNPLNFLESKAQQLATPQPRGSSSGLTWVNGTSSSTITGLDTQVSGSIDGKTVTFDIKWSSSDTALLSFDSTSSSWVTHATSTSQNPDADIYTAMLTGQVYATVNGNVAPYTLERYEVSILGNGLISDGTVKITGTTTEEIKGIFKTIWPLDSNNSTTQFHSINVGFFCGHLDGNASYLGLVGGNTLSSSANGAIVVSGRIAQSSSSLVGRCRGDDIRDGTGSNQFGHTYNFMQAPETDWTAYSGPDGNVFNDLYDFSDQISNMQYLTGDYGTGTGTDVYKYMRIYPGAEHMTNLETTYPGIFESTGVNALRLNAGVCGGAYTKPYAYHFSDSSNGKYYYQFGTSQTRYYVPNNKYCNLNTVYQYGIANAFWVYCKGDDADIVNTILGRNQFTINFRIVYIANGSTGNAWQILYNALNYDFSKSNKRPLAYETFTNAAGTQSYSKSYYESFLQNCLWYDLHKPYAYNESTQTYTRLTKDGSYVSFYDPVPIIPDGQIHEANVTVQVSLTETDFWRAYYDSQESDLTWYPCLSIGIGDNSLSADLATDAVTQTETNYDLWFGEDGLGSAKQRGIDDNSSHFYSSSFNVNGTLNVDVLSFQSVFTNAYGNVANNMKNVDYIFSKDGCTFDSNTKTFTSWNASSGVKIGFNVTAQLTGSNATFYYYRETGTSGSDATVHALYTNSSYQPTNETGYNPATIGAYQ